MLYKVKVNCLQINGKIEVFRRETTKRNPMKILELNIKYLKLKTKKTNIGCD